jgi:hypothetical protein
MSEIKLVETRLLPNAVRMRFADDPNSEKAHYWIDFQVPYDELTVRRHTGDVELGEIEKRYVGSVQLAALRYVQDLLNGESQDLSTRTPTGQ